MSDPWDETGNLLLALHRQARDNPQRNALVEGSGPKRRAMTFAELLQATRRGHRFLDEAGLRPGDTLLMFHPVGIPLYVAMLSAIHAGLCLMFIDPSAGRKLMADCCRLRTPQAFFGSSRAQLLRLLIPEMRNIPLALAPCWLPWTRAWRFSEKPSATGELPGPSARGKDDTALITFTSGSTGQPKGVARTHGFLLAQHAALARTLDLQPGQIDLVTLPIFTLGNLASGVTSVIADTNLARPGMADAAAISRQMESEKVTRITAAPAFFQRLLMRPGSLSEVEHLHTGGAPVFPSLLQALKEAAPRAKVEAVYGSTEAEPIAHLAFEELTDKDMELTQRGGGLPAGLPVAEIRCQVIRDQWGRAILPLNLEAFEDQCLPAEQTGEIVVSGDHVLKGYLNGLGNEETKFLVGDETWHRTGDAGKFDSRGRLWLLGRCSAKLPETGLELSASDLRYPLAIEGALSHFPGITRCAALEWEGQRTLVLELAAGSHGQDREELQALAQQWAIEHCFFLEKIPVDRRHNSKIDYPALREVLAKKRAKTRLH